MRFLLDENVDFPVAAALKARGHDVASIVVEYSSALDDHDVLANHAQQLHDFLVITARGVRVRKAPNP